MILFLVEIKHGGASIAVAQKQIKITQQLSIIAQFNAEKKERHGEEKGQTQLRVARHY